MRDFSNRQQVKEAIRYFCENINSSEKVILLKGAWGIGKTYLIDEIKDEFSKNNNKQEFLNVSLLGVSHIDEVKKRIISPYQREKFLRGFFEESLKFGKIPLVSYLSSNLFDYIAENKLEKKIIVFDDFERKSDTLSSISILGLVDYLKKKNNKIIILANEDKIVELKDNDKTWHILKEKIIDSEIQLAINAKDILNLIFKNKQNNLEYLLIEKLLLDTQLKNIRVITLINNKLKKIYSLLSKEDIYANKKNSIYNLYISDVLLNVAKMFYIYYLQQDYKIYLTHFIKLNIHRHEGNLNNFQAMDIVTKFFMNIFMRSREVQAKSFYQVVYNYIQLGVWDDEKLKTSLKELVDEANLTKNQYIFYDFIDNYASYPLHEFDEYINLFLIMPLKNPGQIFMIYEILKKKNDSRKSLYQEKMESFYDLYAPSLYDEHPEFLINYNKRQEKEQNKILSSFSGMFYSNSKKSYVVKKLNEMSEEEIAHFLKKEIEKKNQQSIAEEINLFINEQEYACFIKKLKSVSNRFLESKEESALKIFFSFRLINFP